MRFRTYTVLAATALASSIAHTQQASPVSAAFRDFASDEAKNLIAAAEQFPSAKYSYKPTPAQMSFGKIVEHLSEGNDYLCGSIGGVKAPSRSKVAATAPKGALVARLKETFSFCTTALAGLDDSKLNEQLDFFGGRKMSRAAVMTLTIGDWADHYSQSAIYMRLNGMLPPTARKPST